MAYCSFCGEIVYGQKCSKCGSRSKGTLITLTSNSGKCDYQQSTKARSLVFNVATITNYSYLSNGGLERNTSRMTKFSGDFSSSAPDANSPRFRPAAVIKEKDTPIESLSESEHGDDPICIRCDGAIKAL